MHRTRALVVRAIPYSEADLVLGLFTESLGLVSVMARRARAPGRGKFHLEPMHTLDVVLRERFQANMLQLSSAAMTQPRLRLVSDFDRMRAAGTALRWIRQAAPHRVPEPELWENLENFLDSLNHHPLEASPTSLLVVAGLRFLQSLGYALELENCVICARSCPQTRPAHIDPVRGGLVCRRCGGTGTTFQAETRKSLRDALHGDSSLRESDVDIAFSVVERALLAHANVTSSAFQDDASVKS